MKFPEQVEYGRDYVVAPSQERGLKFRPTHPTGLLLCRSFAGAWIEIVCDVKCIATGLVAPSQERGLKLL